MERDLKYFEELQRSGLPEPKDVQRMVELIHNIAKLIEEYQGGK